MTAGRRSRTGGRLVTLSTDVGAAYAAQMKAVLVRTVPPGRLMDLTHDLRPHAVAEAAFVVRETAGRFPAGAIHLVVVDPGVGGRRAPLVVECRDGSLLVGPDNGVLAPLAERLGGGRAFRLDPARLRASPRLGTTFDGRDLFAPAAALLAAGRRPERLGAPATLRPLRPRGPVRRAAGASGSVVHIDHFGNVITDVPTAWVPAGTPAVSVRLGTTERRVPMVTSYEAGPPGCLLALGSSFGLLELAVPRGRAADRLRVRVGARVRWRWPARPAPPVRRNGK